MNHPSKTVRLAILIAPHSAPLIDDTDVKAKLKYIMALDRNSLEHIGDHEKFICSSIGGHFIRNIRDHDSIFRLANDLFEHMVESCILINTPGYLL